MHNEPLIPLMSRPAAPTTARTAPATRPSRVPGARAFERAGLCAQCLNVATCTYPCTAGAMVRHCDEFEPPATAARKEAATVVDQVSPLAELSGLCRNCSRASHCTFPKPPSGIWLCEEYC